MARLGKLNCFSTLFIIADLQELRLGERRFEHPGRVRQPPHGVLVPVRHHGRPGVRAEGGARAGGGGVGAAAEGALPQLHEPQDGQVGAGAHLDGRARRLLLRVPAQGVDPLGQEGHAGEWVGSLTFVLSPVLACDTVVSIHAVYFMRAKMIFP